MLTIKRLNEAVLNKQGLFLRDTIESSLKILSCALIYVCIRFHIKPEIICINKIAVVLPSLLEKWKSYHRGAEDLVAQTTKVSLKRVKCLM